MNLLVNEYFVVIPKNDLGQSPQKVQMLVQIPRGQNPIFYGKLHNQDIKMCPIWMDSIDYEQHP